MNNRRLGALVLAAGSVWGLPGCQSCWPAYRPVETRAAYTPRPLLGYRQPRPIPGACCDPGPAVVTPAPALGPAAPRPMPPPLPATLSPPVEVRGFGPPPDTTWHPPSAAAPQPAISETAPQTLPQRLPDGPPDRVRLAVPEPVPESAGSAPRPAAGEDRPRTPPLPVGIPQFAAVRDRVASGLKPLVDGGLDWLQANGYRTVLHIRLPGQDDAADRRLIERFGMRYLSLEISPQTLAQATVDQFNRVVGDSANQPLFVYDRDGMLAGGLWYLHFRTADLATDEVARTRAARHGLKEEPAGAHQEMWLAIQKYLAGRPGDR